VPVHIHSGTLAHHRVLRPDPSDSTSRRARNSSGSSPGGQAADTLAPPVFWEDAAHLADALGPAARRDLLRVQTSLSEVRAGAWLIGPVLSQFERRERAEPTNRDVVEAEPSPGRRPASEPDRCLLD
jgi:hypothetical protein